MIFEMFGIVNSRVMFVILNRRVIGGDKKINFIVLVLVVFENGRIFLGVNINSIWYMVLSVVENMIFNDVMIIDNYGILLVK